MSAYGPAPDGAGPYVDTVMTNWYEYYYYLDMTFSSLEILLLLNWSESAIWMLCL